MFCHHCGADNDDNAYRCEECGTVLRQGDGWAAHEHIDVPTYLVQAILCTLFCCLPFGIVAIVYAAQVDSKRHAGDIRGAIDASEKAKTWCWWSFGLGLAAGVVYLLFMVIAGAASAHGIP